MLSVTILCVGKLKETFYKEGVEEYRKRLSPFCKVEVVELPEKRLPERCSAGDVQGALEQEAAWILEKIPQGAAVIPLCIEGELCSSEKLAERMQNMMLRGVSRLCFILGGSVGLSQTVKDRGSWKLSMSPMTFPHHLARVMLMEQLYRGFQILSGGKYHK